MKRKQINTTLLLIVIALIISLIGWFLEYSKVSSLSSQLENLNFQLRQKTSQIESLQESYLDLNSSYFDLVKRIQPYFKLKPEKQLGLPSLIEQIVKIPIAPLNSIVQDYKTNLSFSITEPTKEELVIFNQINEERKEHSLSPLKLNKAITYVAREHSEDMARRSYFSHKTPEGITVYDRLINNSLYFLLAGENIAVYDSDYLNETVSGWMQSPSHRANVLSDEYNEVGVGVFCVFNGTYCYVTADFVGTMDESSSHLDPEYTVFYHLFDPHTDIGFAQPIKVRVKFTSTEPLEFYILSSKEDWKYYLNTGNKQYVEYVGKVSNLEREFVVYKGYGIMLVNDSPNIAYYNITIEYLSV